MFFHSLYMVFEISFIFENHENYEITLKKTPKNSFLPEDYKLSANGSIFLSQVRESWHG